MPEVDERLDSALLKGRDAPEYGPAKEDISGKCRLYPSMMKKSWGLQNHNCFKHAIAPGLGC
jgi:hypothetical protein